MNKSLKGSEDLRNSPIFITGCPRSGTSMIAGILNICGAWGGKLCGPTPYNKKGQFENTQLKQLVKDRLRADGYDPLGQNPIPENEEDICSDDNLKEKVMKILEIQGYCTPTIFGRSVFFKDAKLCLVWKNWKEAFPNAKWIIVRRKEEGIINSCLSTGFMKKAYHSREEWNQWIQNHKKKFQKIKQHCKFVTEIWTDSIVVDRSLIELERIINLYELNWDPIAIHNFIDYGLWHH